MKNNAFEQRLLTFLRIMLFIYLSTTKQTRTTTIGICLVEIMKIFDKVSLVGDRMITSIQNCKKFLLKLFFFKSIYSRIMNFNKVSLPVEVQIKQPAHMFNFYISV